MNSQTRIEDITIKLTTATSNVHITGIDLSEDSSTSAKLRTSVLTVDNRGAGAFTTGNAIAIYARGATTSSEATFTNNFVRSCTVNALSQGLGTVRGILVSGTASISTRDTNIFVSTVGVGVETSTVGTFAQLRTTTISGGTSDIKQTNGTIEIGPGVDLKNKTAGLLGFNNSVYPTILYYGIKNDLNTSGASNGWLWPGTVIASISSTKSGINVPGYPDGDYAYFRIQQKSLLFGMQVDCPGGPGTSNATNNSTIFTVYKNGFATPFQIGYADGQSSLKTLYTSSLTFAQGDQFSVNYEYTGGTSNATHDTTLQFDLY